MRWRRDCDEPKDEKNEEIASRVGNGEYPQIGASARKLAQQNVAGIRWKLLELVGAPKFTLPAHGAHMRLETKNSEVKIKKGREYCPARLQSFSIGLTSE